ncbi:MAG: putative bifunctional diguanylate cyclase/phosphodiesterase [Geminicoccaceae bacterium]
MTFQAWLDLPARWIGGRKAGVDFLILSASTIVAYWICAENDLLERYVEWAQRYEEYELDEILILGFFSTISVCAFAVRRSLDARQEMQRREASDAEARYLAYHDPLTGLTNRAHFNERLAGALHRAKDSHVAVLVIDLDRFKEVNDTLGHAAGDVLLRTVAERLQGSLRSMDLAGRMGGDEFAVIQTDLEHPEEAAKLAERLITVLAQPYDLDGHEMRCTVSIGIAIGPQDAKTDDNLLRFADAALYQAKRDGRCTFRFYEPGMNEALRARRMLERDMRRAIENCEFSLHYQPLFDLQERQISGYEALLRWQHPTRGNIPPSEFIPLAEETGLILPISDWVLRTACEEATNWEDQTKVAVNLSSVQFTQSDVVDTVRRALDASGLPPDRLELEITESLLMSNTEGVLADLHRLRELGISIAMDDFGTGYSSLAYLWRFPFDKLKIDRSFITDLDTDPKVSEIVRTIINLGRTLNLSVTAEGIETSQQVDTLTEQGCDLGQGFFLGRPVAASDLPHLPTRVDKAAS